MVAYHHKNPVEAGVVKRPAESRWTSHRFYLRLDPPPPWLDVEWALSLLGFADTEAGRKRFDDFVMDVDLEAPSWEAHEDAPAPVLRTGVRSLDWERLIGLARDIVGVGPSEPLNSRRRAMAKVRAVVAGVATGVYAQTNEATARRLGIHTGSVFNLVERTEGDEEIAGLVAELCARMAETQAA